MRNIVLQSLTCMVEGSVRRKENKNIFSVITKDTCHGKNLDNCKGTKPEIPLPKHTAICLTRQLCVHI